MFSFNTVTSKGSWSLCPPSPLKFSLHWRTPQVLTAGSTSLQALVLWAGCQQSGTSLASLHGLYLVTGNSCISNIVNEGGGAAGASSLCHAVSNQFLSLLSQYGIQTSDFTLEGNDREEVLLFSQTLTDTLRPLVHLHQGPGSIVVPWVRSPPSSASSYFHILGAQRLGVEVEVGVRLKQQSTVGYHWELFMGFRDRQGICSLARWLLVPIRQWGNFPIFSYSDWLNDFKMISTRELNVVIRNPRTT